MQISKNILSELQELSPLLAAQERVNVFTVPHGYFDVLSDDILATLGENVPGPVTGMADVPAGYFDHLADSILSKIKAQQNTDTPELRTLSPMLYSIQGEQVFEVPAGYFDTFATGMLQRVKALQKQVDATDELKELSPVLHSLQGRNVFEVPHNYFQQFSANTLHKVTGSRKETVAEELKIVSPVLFGIQNKNVYEVPEGYFENLPGEVLNKVEPQQAKVITMPKRRTSMFRYAAAAVFTGVIAFGVFKFTDHSKTATDPELTAALTIVKNKTLDQEMNKLSDTDILAYLQSNNDNLDVASLVDEKDLPSQADYLEDEKALDKYLNDISVSDLKN